MNRYTGKTLMVEMAMIAGTIAFCFPLYILVNIAIKAPNEGTLAITPAQSPTFSNLISAWREGDLGSAVFNSLIITTASVVVIVLVSAAASYPFARITARWSRWTFALVLVGLLLPMQLGLVPLYMTMRDLGILGTRTSLVLFYGGIQIPFSVFLFVIFLRGASTEYEEAAAVDGAGTFRTFAHVVFPLLRPVTGTVAILNAIHVWNDFLTPLLYLSGSGNETAPVALFAFVGQYLSRWHLVFAGLLITSTPILLAYLSMQKRIIKGFAGGLKG